MIFSFVEIKFQDSVRFKIIHSDIKFKILKFWLFILKELSRLEVMAASYSSFLTTRFYSPVFNTALFDGPFRIYFSQSYESVALKIYHLLQSQHIELWTQFKKWSEQTKKHSFILIYPTQDDVGMAFDCKEPAPICQSWEEGFAIGFDQPKTDEQFEKYFNSLVAQLKKTSLNFHEPSVAIL